MSIQLKQKWLIIAFSVALLGSITFETSRADEAVNEMGEGKNAEVDSFSSYSSHILNRLYAVFNHHYANRLPDTYLSQRQGSDYYLDFCGILALQIYLRDHNETVLGIAEAALQEAYDNRDPTTGLLRLGNSSGQWYSRGRLSKNIAILRAIGGMAAINSTFKEHYEDIIKAYDEHGYNSTTGLSYNYLCSDGTKAGQPLTPVNNNTYIQYPHGQAAYITLFYDAYRITGNVTYLNRTAMFVDAYWKHRNTTTCLMPHELNADTAQVAGLPYMKQSGIGTWLQTLAYLEREKVGTIYYEDNAVNITEILTQFGDGVYKYAWNYADDRWNYRTLINGSQASYIPEMMFIMVDRGFLMACKALNNFTWMDRAKTDMINHYDALRNTGSEPRDGTFSHSEYTPEDLWQQNINYVQTAYLYYLYDNQNESFKTRADDILNSLDHWKDNHGHYHSKVSGKSGKLLGGEVFDFGFMIDEIEHALNFNSTCLSFIPQSHYTQSGMYAYDPIKNGYFIYKISQKDTSPPVIKSVFQEPAEDSVYPDDEVEVYVNVTDDLSGVKYVILNYTANSEFWFAINMVNVEGSLYKATIPQFPYCTNVTYIIIAEDNEENRITTEEMAREYQYHVIPEFPSFTITFLIMITLLVTIRVFRIEQKR